jgi:hypothetical protein
LESAGIIQHNNFAKIVGHDPSKTRTS